jgi:hypothetical protein
MAGRSMQVDLQLNIDNAKRQLNQLNQEAQKAFKSGGSSSQQYQQSAQAAAQQRVQYREALAHQTAYNRSIAEEVRMRQQAMQMAQRHTQQQQQMTRQYAPAGQTLAGGLPGGGILGAGLGLGGTAALAGATALAAAVAAVGSEFNRLGDRARELASTSSNTSSQLGQLRTAIEQAGIRTDINATSPTVVGFEKAKQDLSSNLGDLITHSLNSKFERDKALQEKLSGGLGQGNEDWRRLKEQGADMEQDIGLARQAQQVKWQRAERDFAQSRKEWEIQVGNQRFDLQKQASRQQFDQAVAVQKYQENFQNQQATKAYELSRQFAAQSFGVSQQRAAADFSLNRSDKAFDYNLSQARNQNEFGIGQARNQQEFDISQGRASTSRKNQLFDMAMGGASGLQYLQSARDYNLQRQYANQDFNRQKAIAEQDFNRQKQYAGQDYQIQSGRDARNFGISQGRSIQDFNMQTAQAQAGRQLELEGQEYARRYEGLELFTQLNRQTEDLAVNFARFNQQTGFQQTKFNNQASDMAYDKNLDVSNFNLQTSRQRRNMGYARADFAGQARNDDPLGAAGLGSRDADFAAALAANGQQSGRGDLFKGVNDAYNASNNSIGGMVGDIINQAAVTVAAEMIKQALNFRVGGWNPFGLNANNAGQGPSSSGGSGGNFGGGGQSVVIQTGNNTYNLDPGLTGQIQAYVDEQDRKTQEAINEMIKKQYGG